MTLSNLVDGICLLSLSRNASVLKFSRFRITGIYVAFNCTLLVNFDSLCIFVGDSSQFIKFRLVIVSEWSFKP